MAKRSTTPRLSRPESREVDEVARFALDGARGNVEVAVRAIVVALGDGDRIGRLACRRLRRGDFGDGAAVYDSAAMSGRVD